MWPRFDKEDFKIVGHYLGTLVLMMGMTMIIPLILYLFFQRYIINTFVMSGIKG